MRWINILLLLTVVGCSAAVVVENGRSTEAPAFPEPVVVKSPDYQINKYLGMSNTKYCYGDKVCAISVCMPSPHTPRVVFKRFYPNLNFTIVVTAVYCAEASLQSSEIF